MRTTDDIQACGVFLGIKLRYLPGQMEFGGPVCLGGILYRTV